MFNIPPSALVQELLGRAGGRAEILVHFSATKGYEVYDWNRAAVELFGLEASGPGKARLSWADLPVTRAE